jgi:hypothetical protein
MVKTFDKGVLDLGSEPILRKIKGVRMSPQPATAVTIATSRPLFELPMVKCTASEPP